MTRHGDERDAAHAEAYRLRQAQEMIDAYSSGDLDRLDRMLALFQTKYANLLLTAEMKPLRESIQYMIDAMRALEEKRGGQP